MEPDIENAIYARKVISFAYDGSFRTVEPHTLGYSQSNVLTLCAWQTSGGSGVGWRDFHVSRISQLAVSEEEFNQTRPGYNPQPAKLRVVATA